MELSWEEMQEAIKALSPELQERLYYALEDDRLLSSPEMLEALDDYYNGNLIDL